MIGFSSISDSCCFALLLHSLSMHRLSMAMENSRRRMKANCSLNASWGVMGLGIEPLLFNALSMCDRIAIGLPPSVVGVSIDVP